jgi:hypothetical protein
VQRNEGCGVGREKRRKKEVEKGLENKYLKPLWTRINQRVRHSVITTVEAVVERGFPVEEVGRRDGCFCGYDEAACTRSFRDKRQREEKVP